MTQNVIPVIPVQPILYQLPYGATKKTGVMIFSINYTIPYWTPKEDALVSNMPRILWENHTDFQPKEQTVSGGSDENKFDLTFACKRAIP